MISWPGAASALVALALAACGPGAGEQPEDELPAARPCGLVVATVNGVPISAEQVEHQARGARQSKAEALRALIREELLVQEARRRGLVADREVRSVRARAMANLFLEREFRYTLADVPRADVERAFALNRARYDHPALRRVSHILARLPRQPAPEHLMEARRLAQRVHEIAVAGRLSEEEFKQIAPMVGKDVRAGITLRAESFVTPRKGFAVEEFAAAAFALTRPGEISPIVETVFGSHVIYLAEIIPERHDTLANPAVEKEIRERIFEETRRQAFLRFVAELEKRERVALHLDRIPAEGRP
jgi:peptidyl-prolyl cis-trans isomerase C